MGNLNNMPSVTQPGKRLRVSPNHNLCTYHADLRDYVRMDEGGSCGGRAFQAEATRRQRPRDVKKKTCLWLPGLSFRRKTTQRHGSLNHASPSRHRRLFIDFPREYLGRDESTQILAVFPNGYCPSRLPAELLAEGYSKHIPRETTTDPLINWNSWNSLHWMLFEVKVLRRISMEGSISRKALFGMTTLCVSDHGWSSYRSLLSTGHPKG